MTFVEIHKKGKLIKTIDLTPIEEITNNLENILMNRENWKDRSHVSYHTEILEKMRGMDKDQLEYLSSSFLSLISKYADLYQKILDNPEKECSQIRKNKDFSDLIKKEVELLGLDETLKLIKKYPIKSKLYNPPSQPYKIIKLTS